MGTDLQRWRIVGRDPVTFPEVVAVADALLDPAMAELVWRDSGAGRPRPLPADGAFCRRLGERVGRNWLGPLSAVDYGGPLLTWMGAVIRQRRGEGGPTGWRDDPWRLQREQQPATMACQLRVMAAEQQSGGSGTRWRATVSAEHRFQIQQMIGEAREQRRQLRGVHQRHHCRGGPHAAGAPQPQCRPDRPGLGGHRRCGCRRRGGAGRGGRLVTPARS
ncbi:hypothetical protein [Streptomyces sp. NL15-2K]|uniref:hypothetical protein n=1 Tax=Streptomyces sp. NL15-2K TaxID=376149 RepID=UPI0026EEC0D8|nr:hypothetical protein [Kutzneria buriramensis]WKX15983.1 hypothetical protein Q4V64_54305 [Kutzneria buriramensis]